MRPQRFFVPAIFLLLLGIGDVIVGDLKADEYRGILDEIQNQLPPLDSIEDSSLVRVQLAQFTTEKLLQRKEQVETKIAFYGLIKVGGQLLIAIGCFTMAIGLVVWLVGGKERENIATPAPSLR
jgi:hypothetical protein